MNPIIFLIMQRMRVPLLVLLCAYTVAIIGLTLVPGVEGRMDFFHAIYVISYISTTIGFGEIPGEFSIAQRLWCTVCIYITVVSWVYAIGSLLSLAQNEALRQALIERRFVSTVRRLREPFYLICGYGDTGRALVSALEERYIRTVVLEKRQERINVLSTEDFPVYVPKLCASAGKPEPLLKGGLQHRHCAGVVAVTDDDAVNLHVAITSKLLNPQLTVTCRVGRRETAANMQSFGTDHIINPFTIFAAQLHTALQYPSLHLLRSWLTGLRHEFLDFPRRVPPAAGLWILCSYGRFGKALYKQLSMEKGIEIVTIEMEPQLAGYPKGEFVVGLGTEACTLREARIGDAVGIIAGTDDDVNNLSIVMTARELNPDLFVVLRQNHENNQPIIEAAKADISMQANKITADYVRVLLTTPLLSEFIRLAKRRGEAWVCVVMSRISGIVTNTSPNVWELTINREQIPALYQLSEPLPAGLKLGDLMRSPGSRLEKLDAIPLMLVHGTEKILMPEETRTLQENDRLLWCSTHAATRKMRWILYDPTVLSHLCTGEVRARGTVWKYWRKWRQRGTA